MKRSITDSIGNTPLVLLEALKPDLPGRILVKVEGCNPGGSAKDRVALAMILDAEKRGIPVWNGLWMLVAQAKKSAEWFMDTKLPDSLLSDIHRTLRDRMENIALIGMAGCGKSSIGRLLAKETEKNFVDADTEIELLAGKSIPSIFAEDGEEEFRRLETQVLANLG